MHWKNSAEFGPNFHLYRYCADVRYYSTSVRVYGIRVYWSTLLAEFYQKTDDPKPPG